MLEECKLKKPALPHCYLRKCEEKKITQWPYLSGPGTRSSHGISWLHKFDIKAVGIVVLQGKNKGGWKIDLNFKKKVIMLQHYQS